MKNSDKVGCLIQRSVSKAINIESTESHDQNENFMDNSYGKHRMPLDWECSACTLLNDWQMIECSMCFTPRRRSQRRLSYEFKTAESDICQEKSKTESLCTKRKRRRLWNENECTSKNSLSCCVETPVRNKAKYRTSNLVRENFTNSQEQMQKEDSRESYNNSKQFQSPEVNVILESDDEELSSSCNENHSVSKKRLKLRLHQENLDSPVTTSEFSSNTESSLDGKRLVCHQRVKTEQEVIASELLNTSDEWMQDDNFWKCEKCDSYNFEDGLCSQCNLVRNNIRDDLSVDSLLEDKETEKLLSESDFELQSPYQSSTATDTSFAEIISNEETVLFNKDRESDQNFTEKNPYLCAQPEGLSGELLNSEAVCLSPDKVEVSKESVETHENSKPPQKMNLQFSMSRYTDRVYLYDEAS